MITVQEAKQVSWHDTIYEIGEYNADGTPKRYRVNGKVQFWKTRPNDFKIPVKHGLYRYGYVTQDNARYFTLGARGKKNPFVKWYPGRTLDKYVVISQGGKVLSGERTIADAKRRSKRAKYSVVCKVLGQMVPD